MPRDPAEVLARDGCVRFPATDATRAWAEAAWERAEPRVADPERRAEWLRCAGTWFAGVDLLPNAADGAIGGVALAGPALDVVDRLGLVPERWHAGQVSVTYAGYPRAKEGESPGAARFRMTRDAAHVDGLLPEGPDRRRYLREPHAFILGIALTDAPAAAAPLVVWPGSHAEMGAAFTQARQAEPLRAGRDIDLTDAYKAARSAVFQSHARTELPLAFGEAVLLHRHMLHGIAPWRAEPLPEGRAIAYFRPEVEDVETWY